MPETMITSALLALLGESVLFWSLQILLVRPLRGRQCRLHVLPSGNIVGKNKMSLFIAQQTTRHRPLRALRVPPHFTRRGISCSKEITPARNTRK